MINPQLASEELTKKFWLKAYVVMSDQSKQIAELRAQVHALLASRQFAGDLDEHIAQFKTDDATAIQRVQEQLEEMRELAQA